MSTAMVYFRIASQLAPSARVSSPPHVGLASATVRDIRVTYGEHY
ncbi:MAG: hypothetical protein QOJ06_1553 [Pseudonocardiales bacterium]|nr:hypothetical protein [Pseudonocardiales bacterium]